MNKLILLFFLALPSMPVSGQARVTLSGYIKDAANGEALIGAAVFIKELSAGTIANEYGFYSLTVPAGHYTLNYSYIGYKIDERMLDLNTNMEIVVELKADAAELEEVVVTAELEQANAKNAEMSTNKVDVKTLLKLPPLLGEVDVLRSIQLLPGVSTVGEGASGFNVRGGSVGQNLILLDEAPVYNSSHVFGFFSVFNPDAVKDVKLYKGAVPVSYGGRLASVLDVRMKEGNSKHKEISGGIGTIFSRLSIEGPIKKDKASFIIAARRSYLDILARPFVPLLSDGGALNFYDLTLKTNYKINQNNRVYLSGYFGRDNFRFDKRQGFNWGNATSTLRWNHLFNEKLFSNLTLVYSKYDYKLQFGKDAKDNFNWKSSIENFIVRPQLSYFINDKNELSFGGDAIYYTFVPADATGATNGTPIDISLQKKYNLETALYLGNKQSLTPKVTLDYGVRFSHFNYFGPGTVYSYNDTTAGARRTPIAARQYKRSQSIVNYSNWEPRVSFAIRTSDMASIKGSYNRMAQYLHLISNTTASNPLDVWTSSSNNIKPEIADQFTLGYFTDVGETRGYEVSVEGYVKFTQNQIDYIDNAQLLINRFLEGDLLSGKGRAFGVETYLQKKTGKLTGWVSYTIGRTEVQIAGINRGEWYRARYNQTHNLKIVGMYDINQRWSVSANWVFLSGTPTTFPTSRYVQQGIVVPYNANDSRNNVLIPNYDRLDVSFTLQGKPMDQNGKMRKNKGNWVFSFYNVYARKNAFSIYFSQPVDTRPKEGEPIKTQAKQVSIIGSIIPSVTYNFKF